MPASKLGWLRYLIIPVEAPSPSRVAPLAPWAHKKQTSKPWPENDAYAPAPQLPFRTSVGIGCIGWKTDNEQLFDDAPQHWSTRPFLAGPAQHFASEHWTRTTVLAVELTADALGLLMPWSAVAYQRFAFRL